MDRLKKIVLTVFFLVFILLASFSLVDGASPDAFDLGLPEAISANLGFNSYNLDTLMAVGVGPSSLSSHFAKGVASGVDAEGVVAGAATEEKKPLIYFLLTLF